MTYLLIGFAFAVPFAGLVVLLNEYLRFKRDMTVFYDHVDRRQEGIERRQEKIEQRLEARKDWEQTIENLLGIRMEWEAKVEHQMGVRFEWEASIDKTLGIKSEWERRKELFQKLFDRYRDE